MNPYTVIDTPTYVVAEIADEIYNYVDRINILAAGLLGWQFLDTSDLCNNCPTLFQFFKEKKLLVKNSAITIAVDNSQLPMHIDEPPVIAKINFPVSHCEGWVNRWYYISKEKLEKCPKIINQFGKEVIDISGITDAKIIAEIEGMKQPIVFNSSIPHSVVKITDDISAPRIVASFTFYNEPLTWLK